MRFGWFGGWIGLVSCSVLNEDGMVIIICVWDGLFAFIPVFNSDLDIMIGFQCGATMGWGECSGSMMGMGVRMRGKVEMWCLAMTRFPPRAQLCN